MKKWALVMILCGVGVFSFSIFSFTSTSGEFGRTGYSARAKTGIAVGAVLIVGGALLNKGKPP